MAHPLADRLRREPPPPLAPASLAAEGTDTANFLLIDAIPVAMGVGMALYGRSQGRSLLASGVAGGAAYVGTLGSLVTYAFAGQGVQGLVPASVPFGLGIVLPAVLLTKD